MKQYLIILSLIFIGFTGYSQTSEIEYWRDMGYQSKLKNDFDMAIIYYEKILVVDSSDYDARLALARLFTITDDYDSAIELFNEIYQSDSTDVEALNGLGECYGLLGKDKLSIVYYEKALTYLPNDLKQYFYLAKAYSRGGKLKEAIEIYEKINEMDDTWSEAWAGIGKMYYWRGMPVSAIFYYKKALELDPDNEEFRKEYKNIQSELQFGLSIKVSPIKEIEENYEINALVSTVKLEKRINESFHIDANFLLDNSNRDFSDTDDNDTSRWYNNVWLKVSWIKEHHKVSLYSGYSASDNKVSTLGANWSLNYNIDKVTLKNSFTLGYDYFYYWNKVGSTSVTDEIQLGYKIFGLNARYGYGQVDAVQVRDVMKDSTFSAENPYQTYGISVNCKVLSKPEIKIGLNHSYLNYQYKSSLYYSPFGRNLTGGSVNVYYPYRKLYAYGSFAYNLGNEINYEDKGAGNLEEVKMKVDNWSANIEIGYNYYPLSFSIGASSFYNPYYQNLTGFFAIKILF